MHVVDDAVGEMLGARTLAAGGTSRRPPDPAGADRGADVAMVVSLRRIGRVAAVAAETGARFAREGIEMDPVEWLSSPRVAFGGRSAIEACQSRQDFLKGMLAHGLSLDLDPDRAILDALVSAGAGRPDAGLVEADLAEALVRRSAWQPRLFTATVSATVGDATVFVFRASIAGDRSAFERLLGRRMGLRLADRATVRTGYDPSDPVCALLVSGPLEDELLRVQADPEGAEGEGFDIQLEQRFTTEPRVRKGSAHAG